MLDDDGKLYRRYSNKRVNAAAEGYEFTLTFAEFCLLLKEAGVASSALGVRGYQLARLGDKGGYTKGNCRFIPFTENVAERVFTEKQLRAAKRNAKKMNTRSREQSSQQTAKSWETRRRKGYKTTALTDKELSSRKEALLSSNIKVGKWGWKKKVGELWGVGPLQVLRLARKYGGRIGLQGVA